MHSDHTSAPSTALESYVHNHATLLSIVQSGSRDDSNGRHARGIRLRLERFLVDYENDAIVPFDGERGIEALLESLATLLPDFGRETHDQHLMGLKGHFRASDDTMIDVALTLGAGGQMICEAGPSSSISKILRAIEEWDRKIHVASVALGCDYGLLAEGYNPLAKSPLDVALVPRTSWGLLNAHLGQTGRYARDMMRCTASTRISLAYDGPTDKLEAFQLSTALSPILMFLTDNVRSFRGSGARRCPRMTRSIIWQEVDPTRCGVVPGTLSPTFMLEHYLDWLEGIQPVLFVDAMGTTTSTGKQVLREVLEERVLSGNEALGVLENVYPFSRIGHELELLQADSLRPRFAAGYAAFVKGILCTKLSLGATRSIIGNLRDEDVEIATHELRMHGWDARVYGRPVTDLIGDLLQIARAALDDAEERRLMNELAELWEYNMVPRDAYVRQEVKMERGW